MAKYDFSGWATKNDIRCSDGRTIRANAFSQNDGCEVPLVWNHQHGGVDNILGHALLENREEGVYAYCSFNDSEAGKKAKMLVQHGDIRSLSIYANQLKQTGMDVIHGLIREVSLVLAGANPGATIDAILEHSDGAVSEAIMFFGEEDGISLEHAEEKEEEPKKEEPKKEESKEEEKVAEEKKTEETVGDVLSTLNEKQTAVVNYVIAEALSAGKNNDSEGEKEMKHNLFENEQEVKQNGELSHSAMTTIISDAKRFGSVKESFLQHAAEYGIDNIEYLFPDAKTLESTPSFIKREPSDWVDTVMNGVHHSPFSRIKSVFADITEDEARAKGYIKGKYKKEEVFSLLKRTTTPTTIYKKQKMDRDDVVDITDFDVIAWLKTEMRMMLNEEIARAILFGDGRLASSDDHINETNVRPIYNDDDLYTIKKTITVPQDSTLGETLIDASVEAQDDYQGSGNLTAYMQNTVVTSMLLLKDGFGHRLYKNLNELAAAMNVNKIVKLPKGIIPSGVYGVIVDLKDYNIGADKGGAINMFDDFDIDYNQMKYLIETRCSGALTKPFSAITLKAAE